MTPSYTSGVVCCEPSARAQLQTRRRSATLSVVISSRGLCAWASRVRRQFNQSEGDGFCSMASVTGVKSLT